MWAPTRSQAIARLRRAIDEFVIEGVPTTLPILRALCDEPQVLDASYGTATLEEFAESWRPGESTHKVVALPRLRSRDGARYARDDNETVTVEVNDKLYRVRFPEGTGRSQPALRKAPRVAKAGARAATPSGNDIVSPMHGVVVEMSVAAGDDVAEGQVVAVIEAMKMMNEIRAHRAGSVTAIHATAGATVEANAPLVTVE